MPAWEVMFLGVVKSKCGPRGSITRGCCGGRYDGSGGSVVTLGAVVVTAEVVVTVVAGSSLILLPLGLWPPVTKTQAAKQKQELNKQGSYNSNSIGCAVASLPFALTKYLNKR